MTYREKAITEAKRIAKERDNFVCQKCGKTSEEKQIQGSHVIPVKSGGLLAADPDNIIALCAGCHKWSGDSWHESPMEQQWFTKKFPGLYEYLKLKHQIRPIKKYEWEELYKELKERTGDDYRGKRKNS
jgi:5-methylcytosine-specific restriction endonuclease McrA